MQEYKIPDYKADIAVSFSQGNFGKAKMLIMNEEFDKMIKALEKFVDK